MKSGKFRVPIRKDEIITSVNFVDRFTGEVRSCEVDNDKLKGKGKKKKKPTNGMKTYDAMDSYHRRNSERWELLKQMVSKREYLLADTLAHSASAFTSSLEPLSDDLSSRELSEVLKSDRRTVRADLDTLFDIGVIGKFDSVDEKYMRYWVFNSYLSFNGDVVKRAVEELFEETCFAKI